MIIILFFSSSKINIWMWLLYFQSRYAQAPHIYHFLKSMSQHAQKFIFLKLIYKRKTCDNMNFFSLFWSKFSIYFCFFTIKHVDACRSAKAIAIKVFLVALLAWDLPISDLEEGIDIHITHSLKSQNYRTK